MEEFDKQAWIDSLKVGDEVCDCRELHLKIKEFKDAKYTHYPWFAKLIIHLTFLPDFIIELLPNKFFQWYFYNLEDWYEKFCRKYNIYQRADRDYVVLEDGSGCSLYHCCSPVDHDYKHICDMTTEEKIAEGLIENGG